MASRSARRHARFGGMAVGERVGVTVDLAASLDLDGGIERGGGGGDLEGEGERPI